MKSIRQSSKRFAINCLPAVLVAAALLLGASRAPARPLVGGGYGYRGGYGYGYNAGYGYGYQPNVISGGTSASRSSGSTVPANAVTKLPEGAAPVVVFGKTYYFANGFYYSPVFYGGSTMYVPANP